MNSSIELLKAFLWIPTLLCIGLAAMLLCHLLSVYRSYPPKITEVVGDMCIMVLPELLIAFYSLSIIFN